MHVVNPSPMAKKMIDAANSNPLKVTGTSSGGHFLVTSNVDGIVVRMKIEGGSNIKKNQHIRVNPNNLEVTA